MAAGADEHARAAQARARNAAMLQAAGTADAATALPAQELLKWMDSAGVFQAPPLATAGKRCADAQAYRDHTCDA